MRIYSNIIIYYVSVSVARGHRDRATRARSPLFNRTSGIIYFVCWQNVFFLYIPRVKYERLLYYIIITTCKMWVNYTKQYTHVRSSCIGENKLCTLLHLHNIIHFLWLRVPTTSLQLYYHYKNVYFILPANTWINIMRTFVNVWLFHFSFRLVFPQINKNKLCSPTDFCYKRSIIIIWYHIFSVVAKTVNDT